MGSTTHICKTCGEHEESGYCDSCDSCYGICECDDCDCYTCKGAESFEAPHVGSGALMDISKGTDLSSFTTSELTKSSAIHGDFDTASLDYSGHQNIEVRQSEFAAPTGYNELGPRPFYGNPRKMAFDRWGNRRYIRRRKDGTYMKNVDVGRSLAMDRRRKSKTWAPAGFRDQGDGSPPLLMKLLDMFRGVDEVVLMAESDLMCAEHDDYFNACGCGQEGFGSESEDYDYEDNPDDRCALCEVEISGDLFPLRGQDGETCWDCSRRCEWRGCLDRWPDDSEDGESIRNTGLCLECIEGGVTSEDIGRMDSESDAYIYAYNDGHTDARRQDGYNPSTSDREITSFNKIFKQAEEYWFEEYNDLAIPKNPTKMEEFMLDSFSAYDYYNPEPNDTLVQGLAIADDSNFLKIYDVVAKQDGIIDSSHPAEALIIAIKVWNALY